MNEKELNAISRIVSHPDWKYMEKFLLRATGYEQDINIDNPTEMARLVGARSVYIKLKQIIRRANGRE